MNTYSDNLNECLLRIANANIYMCNLWPLVLVNLLLVLLSIRYTLCGPSDDDEAVLFARFPFNYAIKTKTKITLFSHMRILISVHIHLYSQLPINELVTLNFRCKCSV